MKSLTRRVAEGAMWMVFLRSAVRGLGLLSTIILARVLTPTDFGLVAMATLVAGIVEIMAQFGFDTFLIRRKDDPCRENYGTIWTLTILRGLAVAIVLASLAVWAADLFNDDRLVPLIYVLAASAVIEGFQNIFLVKYERDLNFRVQFWFQVAKKGVMLLTTLSIAIIYHTYWALMAGIVVSRIFGVVFSYLLCPERPSFTFKHAGEAFSFSKWIMLSNLVFYFRDNSGQWLIGRLMDAGSLGIYLLAKEISELPTTELVHPIQRSLLPGFARLIDDPVAMRRAYLRAYSTLLQIAAPIGVGLALVAEPLVACLLGDKWTGVVPILQILGFYGAVRVAYSAAGSVYLALGKPRIDAMLALASVAVGIPAMWFGATQYGLAGAAYGVFLMTAVGAPMHLITIGRLLSIGAGDFLRVSWRTCAGLAVMVLVVSVVKEFAHWPGGFFGPWIELVALSFTGAVTYAASVAGLWVLSGAPESSEREMISLARGALFSAGGKRSIA
jgi:O-antigen/teichoic acid export membrane protein